MASTTMTTNETMTSTAAPNPGGDGAPDPATTAATDASYADFFDDPHNQATYIVLPVMVIIYGGCASIYCVAKCRKSCRKRARRQKHEQMMAQEELDDTQQQNTFDNMSYENNFDKHDESGADKPNNSEVMIYSGSIQSPIYPYVTETNAAKPMLQQGVHKMGYNIMPLPNSTEDPVINVNIDIHLKNAFAMIEHAARDIKMQQALTLRSCPDRYPADGENEIPLPRRGGGYKRKYFIAM